MAKFAVSLKARLILQNHGRLLLLKQTKPNGGNYSLVGGTIERKEYATRTRFSCGAGAGCKDGFLKKIVPAILSFMPST